MSNAIQVSSTAERVCAEAVSWLGTPYRHQASRKGVGADCLGLVRGVWRSVYGSEPASPGPYSSDWAESGCGDPLMDAARRYCTEKRMEALAPGDLLIFRWRRDYAAKHAGVYVGGNRFVHAYEGNGVVLSPLVYQWRWRVAGVFTFPEITDFS